MTPTPIRKALDWVARVFTQPRSELDRWERAVLFAHDLAKCGAKQLRQDRAAQMAGALTFRTLFGLLPVLVVAALVVRFLRGPDKFVELLGKLIDATGVKDVGTGESTVADLLYGLANQAAYYDTRAIGWVGTAVLIYAAISLMVTIENSFNTVCRAAESRSWARRVPTYWFVLTIGPVAIGLSGYFRLRVSQWIQSLDAWQWLLELGAVAWVFTVTWLLLFAVYRLVPNAHMRLRPVLIGSFVAAVLLSVGKHFLGVYLENAVKVTQFGGSLGLVPLFMFWVYVMWLVVLFGLEVSATLQTLAGRSLEELQPRKPTTGLVDPAAILPVMEAVGQRFKRAAAATPHEIADETGLPEATVRLMLTRLIDRGVLHRLDRDDLAVSLARPPEQIDGGELVEIGFSLVDDGGSGPRSEILKKLREAQRSLAAGSCLLELLPRQPVVAVSDQADRGE